jgi:hypothetical protein
MLTALAQESELALVYLIDTVSRLTSLTVSDSVVAFNGAARTHSLVHVADSLLGAGLSGPRTHHIINVSTASRVSMSGAVQATVARAYATAGMLPFAITVLVAGSSEVIIRASTSGASVVTTQGPRVNTSAVAVSVSAAARVSIVSDLGPAAAVALSLSALDRPRSISILVVNAAVNVSAPVAWLVNDQGYYALNTREPTVLRVKLLDSSDVVVQGRNTTAILVSAPAMGLSTEIDAVVQIGWNTRVRVLQASPQVSPFALVHFGSFCSACVVRVFADATVAAVVESPVHFVTVLSNRPRGSLLVSIDSGARVSLVASIFFPGVHLALVASSGQEQLAAFDPNAATPAAHALRTRIDGSPDDSLPRRFRDFGGARGTPLLFMENASASVQAAGAGFGFITGDTATVPPPPNLTVLDGSCDACAIVEISTGATLAVRSSNMEAVAIGLLGGTYNAQLPACPLLHLINISRASVAIEGAGTVAVAYTVSLAVTTSGSDAITVLATSAFGSNVSVTNAGAGYGYAAFHQTVRSLTRQPLRFGITIAGSSHVHLTAPFAMAHQVITAASLSPSMLVDVSATAVVSDSSVDLSTGPLSDVHSVAWLLSCQGFVRNCTAEIRGPSTKVSVGDGMGRAYLVRSSVENTTIPPGIDMPMVTLAAFVAEGATVNLGNPRNPYALNANGQAIVLRASTAPEISTRSLVNSMSTVGVSGGASVTVGGVGTAIATLLHSTFGDITMRITNDARAARTTNATLLALGTPGVSVRGAAASVVRAAPASVTLLAAAAAGSFCALTLVGANATGIEWDDNFYDSAAYGRPRGTSVAFARAFVTVNAAGTTPARLLGSVRERRVDDWRTVLIAVADSTVAINGDHYAAILDLNGAAGRDLLIELSNCATSLVSRLGSTSLITDGNQSYSPNSSPQLYTSVSVANSDVQMEAATVASLVLFATSRSEGGSCNGTAARTCGVLVSVINSRVNVSGGESGHLVYLDDARGADPGRHPITVHAAVTTLVAAAAVVPTLTLRGATSSLLASTGWMRQSLNLEIEGPVRVLLVAHTLRASLLFSVTQRYDPLSVDVSCVLTPGKLESGPLIQVTAMRFVGLLFAHDSSLLATSWGRVTFSATGATIFAQALQPSTARRKSSVSPPKRTTCR